MPDTDESVHPPGQWRRRFAAVALFALQASVVSSAIWERQSHGRLSAHVEQDGTRHLNLHDESTCALCSQRAQSSMPAPAATPGVSGGQKIVPTLRTYSPPARIATATNHSRAPPRND